MIVVEVLGRGGRVTDRVRSDAAEVVIGRGYDCEVVVNDPYVDPRAVAVRTDPAGLVVTDLGAANGVWLEDGSRVSEEHRVEEGSVIRIGRSRIRLLRGSTPVAPALIDSAVRSPLEHPWAPVVAGVLYLAAYGFSGYMTSVEEVDPWEFVGGELALLMLVALWAGCWALGTRIARGRARFLIHATLTFAMLTLLVPLGWISGVLAFLWPGAVSDALVLLTSVSIATLLLYAHLRYSSAMRRRARALVAIAITGSLTGLGYLFAQIDPERESDVQTHLGAVYPVPAPLIPATGSDDFLQRVLSEMEDVGGEEDADG